MPQAGTNWSIFEPRLAPQTCPLAGGFSGRLCIRKRYSSMRHVLLPLVKQGVRLVALRCAGFNQVDLEMAEHLGLTVTRVPAYSPTPWPSIHWRWCWLWIAKSTRLTTAFARAISPWRACWA